MATRTQPKLIANTDAAKPQSGRASPASRSCGCHDKSTGGACSRCGRTPSVPHKAVAPSHATGPEQSTAALARDFSGIPAHSPRPRLSVASFLPGSGEHSGDKSFSLEEEYQDQSLSKSEFAASPCGVNITLKASDTGRTVGGVFAGAAAGLGAAGLGLGIGALAGASVSTGAALGILGGGAFVGGLIGGLAAQKTYYFTQTIATNQPKGGATSPYVDPQPNDDTLPFYYTESERSSLGNTFIDTPCRPKPAAGATDWDATVCVDTVEGNRVTVHECLTYGFSRDSTGAVTTRAPSATGAGTHLTILSSGFPGWTFTTPGATP